MENEAIKYIEKRLDGLDHKINMLLTDRPTNAAAYAAINEKISRNAIDIGKLEKANEELREDFKKQEKEMTSLKIKISILAIGAAGAAKLLGDFL